MVHKIYLKKPVQAFYIFLDSWVDKHSLSFTSKKAFAVKKNKTTNKRNQPKVKEKRLTAQNNQWQVVGEQNKNIWIVVSTS